MLLLYVGGHGAKLRNSTGCAKRSFCLSRALRKAENIHRLPDTLLANVTVISLSLSPSHSLLNTYKSFFHPSIISTCPTNTPYCCPLLPFKLPPTNLPLHIVIKNQQKTALICQRLMLKSINLLFLCLQKLPTPPMPCTIKYFLCCKCKLLLPVSSMPPPKELCFSASEASNLTNSALQHSVGTTFPEPKMDVPHEVSSTILAEEDLSNSARAPGNSREAGLVI